MQTDSPQPNIMDDLFSGDADNGRAKDKRYQRDEVKVESGPRNLSDTERMAYIFKDVVMQSAPTKQEIATYVADPKKYRTRIEEGDRQVEGFIGKVSEPQWAWQVSTMIDIGNPSTYIAGLRNRQGNGVWKPIAVGVQFDRDVTMRLRPIDVKRLGLPEGGDESKIVWTGPPPEESYPVGVDIMRYRILWCDTAGREDLVYDAKGDLASVPVVKIEQSGGMSPELIEAMIAQSKATTAAMTALSEKRVDEHPTATPPTPSSTVAPKK